MCVIGPIARRGKERLMIGKNRKLLEPGSTFEYNDVRVNLLAYSLLAGNKKTFTCCFAGRRS
jgi:hypothetical protein